MVELVPLYKIPCDVAFSVRCSKQAYTYVKFLERLQLVLLNKVNDQFVITAECADCFIALEEKVTPVGSVTI